MLTHDASLPIIANCFHAAARLILYILIALIYRLSEMVGPEGVEPSTNCLKGNCSTIEL